jgi:hypothetical protein
MPSKSQIAFIAPITDEFVDGRFKGICGAIRQYKKAINEM